MYEEVMQLSLTYQVKESDGRMLTTPASVAMFFDDMKNLAQESFQIVTVNTKNKAIQRHMVTLGTLNQSLVHPRDVFRLAIMDNAAAVILVHNHPSGDPSPSSEDIKVTRKLVEAGEIMGIKILDHVIIGATHEILEKNNFLSLREAGLVKFK